MKVSPYWTVEEVHALALPRYGDNDGLVLHQVLPGSSAEPPGVRGVVSFCSGLHPAELHQSVLL